MASYNPNNIINTLPTGGKSFFSRILRDLSYWSGGMKYDDLLFRNKESVSRNETPEMVKDNLYSIVTTQAINALLEKKAIPYLDKAYGEKKRILREYSIKDEIRDFIERICNETIVYDDEKYFCTPSPLSKSYSEEIRNAYSQNFEMIFNAYGFNNGKYAWDLFKDLLIEGNIAFEIIYDDRGEKIIGFSRIEAETLLPSIIPESGVNVWIQYPDDPSNRRVILDSKIIFITYKSHNEYNETSYVEGLIKPYNQFKLIEQTKIMFSIAHASLHQVFKIPIANMSKKNAEQEISKLAAAYAELIEFDEMTGTLTLNGSKNIPFNKQYWLPVGESGSPEMSLESPEGINLLEDKLLEWFYRALKRAAKIPFGRFDSESGGGKVFDAESELTRDENTFMLFIRRLRVIYKELLTKPLRLQMLIDFPELRDDPNFINDIKISFASNELFEKSKKVNILIKQVEAISKLMEFKIGEESYFHPEFLIREYMDISEEKLQENSFYKKKFKNDVASNDTELGGGGNENEIPKELEQNESEPPTKEESDEFSC